MDVTGLAGSLTGSAAKAATPLIFAAAGEVLVQRSGVVNVGLEGILLSSAFAATITTYTTHSPWLGLCAAIITGALMAALFSAFTIYGAADQVVVGVVLNLFAMGATGTLFRLLFATHAATTGELPYMFHTIPVLTPFTLVAVAGAWYILFKTRAGLEIRACGEKPSAAAASGINVLKLRTYVTIFGGVLAGIGGAFLSIGQNNAFAENMSAGRGFIALAIVTAGRWNPIGCLIAALIFGLTDALQFQGQAIGMDHYYRLLLSHLHLLTVARHFNINHVPYNLFLAVPYVVTLVILMGSSKSTRAPASLGKPYVRI